MSAREAALIPVTLLTGFLGSGKTTLLNRLLRAPALAGAAVIVNEFGEVGLDHLLIETSEERFALLDNGCLCCTVRGDLVDTLKSLFDRRVGGAPAAPTRVLIETTGLADPAPILHTLIADATLAAHFRVDSVTTTVDAVNGENTLAAHPEAIKQVAVADHLLLTKTDLVAAPALDRLRRQLRAINPAARLRACRNGEIAAKTVFGGGFSSLSGRSAETVAWFRQTTAAIEREARRAAHGAECADPACRHPAHGLRYEPGHAARVNTFSIVIAEPLAWTAFSQWLEYLAAMKGEDLLRFKGLVHIAEKPETPIVVHGVQHVFHPPRELSGWPSGDRRTRLVFITRDIPRRLIEDTLSKFGAIARSRIERPVAA